MMEPHDSSSALWISWYDHRRTGSLCEAWNVPLLVLRSDRGAPLRWCILFLRTLKTLFRERPGTLFVQNPSLGLALMAVALKPVFRFRLVVDAHNEGVRPYVRSGWLVRLLTEWVISHATVTIVTNDELASDVDALGGTPQVLPDALPVPSIGKSPVWGKPARDLVVVISTFAPDEPTEAVLLAAGRLRHVDFAVTGKTESFKGDTSEVPDNVTLTGFLPDCDYWTLLSESTVVCDLTLMEDCLVCGAYEALCLGKPMVLSENAATRRLFGDAAILCQPDPRSIASALSEAIEQQDELRSKAARLSLGYNEKWRRDSKVIKSKILQGIGVD